MLSKIITLISDIEIGIKLNMTDKIDEIAINIFLEYIISTVFGKYDDNKKHI